MQIAKVLAIVIVVGGGGMLVAARADAHAALSTTLRDPIRNGALMSLHHQLRQSLTNTTEIGQSSGKDARVRTGTFATVENAVRPRKIYGT